MSQGVSKGSTKASEALAKFHDEDELEKVYDLRMLLRLWPFVKPYRRMLFGSFVLLVLMAIFGLARPLIMKAALDGFQEPDGAERLSTYGAILAGVIVAEQAMAFPQIYWVQAAGAHGMARLRRDLFAFLHSRSLAFFDRTPIGRLVTRVTNDVDAMGEMFSSGALNAFGDLLRLVAIVAVMVSMDWRMSLFAFAGVPPIALFVNWTRKRMRRAYRTVRSKTARMNAYLNEQVSGMAVVQAYAREDRNQREFDDINYAYRVANTRAIGLDAALDASIEMVGSVCLAAILWYAGLRNVEGMSFGKLFAFIAYIDMFFMPVRNLSARYTQIQSALAGAERVFQLLASTEEDAPGKPAEDWPRPTAPAFELEGVTFSYKPGLPVLHDVSLQAARGESIAIVGPTGSGKSTITALLLRLYEAQQGTVRVLGRNVADLERSQLRNRFAVVPQDVFLFPGTIATNVAAGYQEVDRERVLKVIKNIGADLLVDSRAGGIDAEVLERGSNFSAGERQLIAFARAMYRDPDILVLDEPTANIDSDTEVQMQRAMDAAMAGRTALMVAHRLSTIRGADRIVCLHHGRIVEQGSHEELLALEGVYADLYRLQDAQNDLRQRAEKLGLEGLEPEGS